MLFQKLDYSLLCYVLSLVNTELKQETEDMLQSVVFVLRL